MSENIKNIMDTTLEKIKGLAASDTVIGEPINVGEVTLIPVSKLSYGFASGGSDFTSKIAGNSKQFGGGGGAGASVTPVAFIVVNGSDVKILHVGPEPVGTAENVINMLPEFFEKIKGLFKKEDKTEIEE